MTTGQAVRTLREVAGLTARDVARAAGVSESYLSRVETGAADASPEWIGTVTAAIAESIRRRSLRIDRVEEMPAA
ncbi:helix-turn-helix domain-containing protein [Microbacterium sp. No. 7]|uniref:helix-turn-helix domain-containing protein n=1 Tax=Microbacterium sp. No. 7 TaxID=1714373 RepID=UPI0009E6FA90